MAKHQSTRPSDQSVNVPQIAWDIAAHAGTQDVALVAREIAAAIDGATYREVRRMRIKASYDDSFLAIISGLARVIGPPCRERYGMTGDFVYVVWWPDGVFKVGYTANRSRWRKFVCRGAKLVYLSSFTNCTDAIQSETAGQEWLAESFPMAFRCKEDALGHLGDGCGWTECYQTGEAA